MAYGNKYYLDFYDRFNNQWKVYVGQQDYVGSVIDVTGGSVPLKLHWMGEGDDKYKPIKGSTCQLSLMSTSDQQFLDIFTNTSKAYRITVLKGLTSIWVGDVDPDSYREPFLYQPYESVLHASDGLGELKNIPFPKPSTSDIYTFEQPLIYFIFTALAQTGHDRLIHVANNISYFGASTGRVFDDVYVTHQTFRDDDDNFISCYDVLEKILKAFGCRLYYWNARIYIERIDYKADSTIDYNNYDLNGVYTSTTSSVDQRLAMTGVSGSPLCVWVDQSPDMEIVPGWKGFDVSHEPGERINILKSTTRRGTFVDEDFQLNGTTLEPRWWTLQVPSTGTQSQGYNFSWTKFYGSDYIRLNGIGFPSTTNVGYHGRIYSDDITMSGGCLAPATIGSDDASSMRFKFSFKARVASDNPNFWVYRPFLRFQLKVVLEDTVYVGSMPNGFFKYQAGTDSTIYFGEDSNGLFHTTASDWLWDVPPGNGSTYYAPGRYSCRFKDFSDHEFTVTSDALVFQGGINISPKVNLWVYPVFTTLDTGNQVGATYTDYMDLTEARVGVIHGSDAVQDAFGYTKNESFTINDNNRNKPGELSYSFGKYNTAYNEKYYHQYVLLDGSNNEDIWWSVGGQYILKSADALVNSTLFPVIRSAYNRPTRKITGEIISDDLNMGSVLVDPYSKLYICNGVEFDPKFSRWQGEWIQLYSADTVDSGDFDPDDFGSDFWTYE